MKLEVGMYVRYKRGSNGCGIEPPERIAKVLERINNSDFLKLDNGNDILENDVVKASYNIIDILEVGDYVNGEKVLEINCKWEYMDDDSDTGVNEVYDGLELQKGRIYFEYEIKSVVTKEQMEQMEYKVE